MVTSRSIEVRRDEISVVENLVCKSPQ